ncbi:MAG TPA: hypothetical protein VKR55_09925 [Bradyrhizobium sp.]|uniref:hypothetical protein n=1 Tax=Bradyrhizobium sp. TaxID=376 RepID=UPI002CAE6C22|nr:hypothetical protein [Bradyrhizobium sp.]HLZ02454.1 hypothetical protein [Bradyrhizobium sp.]
MSGDVSGFLAAYGALVALQRSAIVAAILWGLWIGLGRTMSAPEARQATWLTVAGVLITWLVAVWLLAGVGAFEPGMPIPLLPPAIVLPLIIGFVALRSADRIRAAIDAVPSSWLVGLQVYRVFGGVFVVFWALGALPGAWALPAGLGDLAVGILALPAAVAVASGTQSGRAVGVAWNLLGIADVVSAVTLGALTAPGPLQLQALAPDHSNLVVGAYPIALTPAFVVPLSLILHGLSLRRLRRQAARDGLRLAAAG